MAVEASLAALQHTVSAMGPVQLAVLGALAFVVLAFVGRVVARNIPNGKPPILEGVPFVGGLLKFTGVREASARNATQRAARCARLLARAVAIADRALSRPRSQTGGRDCR